MIKYKICNNLMFIFKVSQTCSTPQKHLAQSKILFRDLESSFNNDVCYNLIN